MNGDAYTYVDLDGSTKELTYLPHITIENTNLPFIGGCESFATYNIKVDGADKSIPHTESDPDQAVHLRVKLSLEKFRRLMFS